MYGPGSSARRRGDTRQQRASNAPPPLQRGHALGFAVLLLTVLPAYFLSRVELVAGPGTAAIATSADEATDTMPRLDPLEINAHIREVAVRHGISPLLVAAIIEAESEFNPRAVSRKGAQGLMQLMPATASSLRVEDAFDPFANVEGGVRHLRRLMDRFDGNLPLVLAAYNAGEHTVSVYGGVPPYRETRRYVRRIMRRLGRDWHPPTPARAMARPVVAPVAATGVAAPALWRPDVPKPRIDQRRGEPRAVEPRPIEPRSAEPRHVEPRPVEPRPIEPRPVDRPIDKRHLEQRHADAIPVAPGVPRVAPPARPTDTREERGAGPQPGAGVTGPQGP